MSFHIRNKSFFLFVFTKTLRPYTRCLKHNGQVVHAAKIEVNEKGTEAAAATVVAEAGGAAPPQEGITLILDRPFLYGIIDLQTGVPLFLGTYE